LNFYENAGNQIFMGEIRSVEAAGRNRKDIGLAVAEL
jgi:hypothetical protein